MKIVNQMRIESPDTNPDLIVPNIINNFFYNCFLAEAMKYSEDIAPMMTLRRVLDLSYRLNAGTVRYSVNVIKEITDPVAWVITY